MYWLLTILAAGLIAMGFHIFGNQSLSNEFLINSLLFLPNFDDNGKFLHPILFPGWTLNYEMMFYTLFALAIVAAADRRRSFLIISVIAIFWIFQVTLDNALLDYLGADIILSFVGGIIVWNFIEYKSAPAWLAWVLIVLSLTLLASTDYTARSALPHSHIIVCLGATLLVYAAVSLEKTGATVGAGWWERQGNASYSLYLIHPFVIQVLSKISIKLGLNIGVAGLVFCVSMMLLCSGIAGTVVHRYVENVINRLIRGRSLEAVTASHGS